MVSTIKDEERLRALEFSLLDSSWRKDTIEEPLSESENLAKDTVSGNFVQVLTSSAFRELTLLHIKNDELVFEWPTGVTKDLPLELTLLSIGVSLLQAFVQTNWTGPELPLDPLDLLQLGNGISSEQFNTLAIGQLRYADEPVYHLTRKTGFLALAVQIFESSQWQLVHSIPEWRLRAGLTHLGVLYEIVPLAENIITDAEKWADECLKPLTVESSGDLLAAHLLMMGKYHLLMSNELPKSRKLASETFLESAKAAQLRI